MFTHFESLQKGVTLKTVSPLPAGGIPDREKDCEEWKPMKDPLCDARPVARKLVYLIPRGKLHGSSKETKSVREQWVRLEDGGMMDVPALGYLSDMVCLPSSCLMMNSSSASNHLGYGTILPAKLVFANTS